MQMVHFRAGTFEIRAEVLEESLIRSQHTGKELFTLAVEFRVNENRQSELQIARNAPDAVLLPEGEALGEIPISIEQNMHSFTVGRREQIYKWTLTERESFKLESLQLGDTTLFPYKFEEEVQNGLVHIQARVEIDAGTRDKLSELPHYFPVIRHGISSEPLSMRFGQPLWSPSGSENAKYRYVLVEERYDATNPHGFFEPQFGNMQNTAVETKVQITRLLNSLAAKGLLSADEVRAIIEVPQSELRKERRLIHRVNDLDEWLD